MEPTQGIHVEDVVKTWRAGTVRALDRISLHIAPGETVGIIGPNGAGKTTLFGCLLGFLRPDSGRITVDGLPADDLAVRRVTGYLPERLVMDRWMTGLDFLAYHHELAGLPADGRRDIVARELERVGLAPDAGDKPIRSYSRGMLQRLGLAQALLGEPRWLFLDEPVSGVDPAGVLLFRRRLAEAKSAGCTVLLNSHQLAEVERVCDRVVFVQHGRVQSVETVHAGAEVARVLRLRLIGEVGRDALASAAAAAGAELREHAPPHARFAVADDAGAARLIAALVGAGVAVAEAAPEEGRLERLFTGGGAA
jgi:ABC-2 type transport system ATP-binding protein